MKIIIVGSGKLATALLTSNREFQPHELVRWETSIQNQREKAVLIHAGSGRQFEECVSYCSRTKSVLIQLSTGLDSAKKVYDFPHISCPNASLLVVKALQMIQETGKYFENYKISIVESHQSTKKTEAGTAFAFARSLNVSEDKVISVRNPEIQRYLIGIPEDFLSQHAYHKITVSDGDNELTIETRAYGHKSYVNGIKKIVEAIIKGNLKNKQYSILEILSFKAAV